ncbi:metallopeptidase family protein [candidate division WOR-3 bacterium]|nr:metallopeptidase family protein [candidate division WOR-3 bacterium]
MTHQEFEQTVRDAVKELPKLLRDKMDNIDIVIEDEPVMQKSLLGLYQGVPLKKRSHWYGNVMPDKITLFKDNIERVSIGEGNMKEWIRKVIIHEIGHHFGFGEEELRALE